jgi:hypothetical protein
MLGTQAKKVMTGFFSKKALFDRFSGCRSRSKAAARGPKDAPASYRLYPATIEIVPLTSVFETAKILVRHKPTFLWRSFSYS